MDRCTNTQPDPSSGPSEDPRVTIEHLEDLREETIRARAANDFNLHLIEDMLEYQHELLGEDVPKE